ncbi:hypothetical protein [Providencia rettgeri]|uniref:hypothetical protein n=1 Tax=Providencia rettgeri TaxID=587 RepID=UPI002361B7D8|nr:hypothetical protein [Providencia rettgeri]
MCDSMQKALQSVIDVHVLIEDVFTGRNSDKSITPLLACFTENFKMVTIGGNRIGLAEVAGLFSQNVGAKPSFLTVPFEVTPLFEDGERCWIQYQERQENEGITTLRTSTVCIRVVDNQCYWEYLHETPVLNN